MKKKVIAIALYIALLMTSLVPVTALAVGDTEGGTEPPVCTCATKCAEGAVNSDCPVCGAEGAEFAQVCKGQVPQPEGDQGGSTPDGQGGEQGGNSPDGQGGEQGGNTSDGQGGEQGGSTPDGQGGEQGGNTPEVPVCTCTTKCAEGAGNPDCMVCGAEGADLSACAGKADESGDEELGGTPSPGPSPVCTCTAKCSEGNVNPDCQVCAADWNSCAFTVENGDPEPDNKPETVTVTDWSWVDEQGILAADGKLYLPSAVTAESLEGIKALLPQYIQVGEEKIALTWTYDEATQSFAAALPEGYDLAEGAKPLTVETVNMGADTLEELSVQYIDASGAENTATATLVTAGDTAWSDTTTGGWYVVEGDTSIDARVTVTGNVHLILTDGCKLSVNRGIEVTRGNSLTIYAQSGGTGELTATATGADDAGIGGGFNIDCGAVTLNGGKVTAIGESMGAGIGGNGLGGIGGDITINGGIVEATGGGSGDGIGGTGGNIVVNGGQITARTGGSGAGIGGSRGNITISGGTVEATGGNGGAGIGGTSGATQATVTIKGGNVTAIGKNNSDGIGGTVTIEGGSVTATATNGSSIDGSVTVRPQQNYCIAVLTGSRQENAAAVADSPFDKVTVITNLVSSAQYFSSHVEPASIAVTSISLDATDLQLKLNGTATLKATVSPAGASNPTLFWSSNAPDIVSVDQNGVVKALKAGTAVITASATDGSNVKAECTVTVTVPVSSVTMSRSSLRIYEGKSYSLSAAVSPADATNKSLYWSSSNPDIASVDQNGKVTGHKPGVCTVFAQAQDGSKVFAACTVRVLHWYPGATPITGDSSHLGLWIGVLAVSACAIAAGAFILVKKRKSK